MKKETTSRIIPVTLAFLLMGSGVLAQQSPSAADKEKAARDAEMKARQEQFELQQQQLKEQQISKEDAERILNALRDDERDIQEKLKRKVRAKGDYTGKDW